MRPVAAALVPCLLAALAALASPACRGAHNANAARAGAVPADAPSRTRERRVREVTLHTVEVGPERAPLRIAVHGGPGLDHTYLRPWLDPLGARARLVYVDLRGHGRSSAPADASGYTIVAAAADLAELIAQLGGSAPADVIGHAFGAAVVLELAARHPERVRRVVLVDPMRDAAQLRAIPRASREALGADGWQRILDMSTPQGTLRDPRAVGALFRALGRMWWHAPPSDGVIDRMARDMVYRAETDAHFLVDGARWDGRSRASEVRAQALVVSGAGDLTFPAADSRALAERLPHGRYAEIERAGHCPFIEQPAGFLAAVDGFLLGAAAPAPARSPR